MADSQTIFNCIQAAFEEAGLNKITSVDQSIVWSAIPASVVEKIAQSIQACIKAKIKDPGDLIGPISAWAGMNKVMPVKTLIKNIQELMQ